MELTDKRLMIVLYVFVFVTFLLSLSILISLLCYGVFSTKNVNVPSHGNLNMNHYGIINVSEINNRDPNLWLQNDSQTITTNYNSIPVFGSNKNTLIYSGIYISDINNLQTNILLLDIDVNNLQTDVTTLNTDIGNLETDMSLLQSDITTLNTDVDNLQTDVTTLQSDITTLNTDVDNLQTDVTTLQSDVTTLNTDVDNLQTDVTTLQADITTLNTDVDNLQTDVTTLQSDITTLNTDVDNLQTDVTTLQADVTTLNTDVVNLQTNVTTLQSDVNILNTDVGNLETDINSLQADITTLNTDVDNLQTDVTTLQSDVGNLETDINSLQADVTTLNTDIGNLQTDITTLQTDVLTLDTDVSTLQTNVSNLDNDVETLQIDVNSLETSVNTIQTDIITLDTDVNNLETDVGTLQTSIITLDTDVDNLQTDVSNLQLDVNAINNVTDSLQTSVEVLETDVETIQNSLVDGTLDMFISNIQIDNLSINLPVKTNATKDLISELITLPDCAFFDNVTQSITLNNNAINNIKECTLMNNVSPSTPSSNMVTLCSSGKKLRYRDDTTTTYQVATTNDLTSYLPTSGGNVGALTLTGDINMGTNVIDNASIIRCGRIICTAPMLFTGVASGGPFIVGFTANVAKLVATGTLTVLNNPSGMFTPIASTGAVRYTGSMSAYFQVNILFNIFGSASAQTYSAWVSKNSVLTPVAPRAVNFTTSTPAGYQLFYVSNVYQLFANDTVQLAAQYTSTANVNIFDVQVQILPAP